MDRLVGGSRPAAYLAFGDTYGREREEAERRQWPVITALGKHLQLINDPQQVATDLITLMSRIGITSPHQ